MLPVLRACAEREISIAQAAERITDELELSTTDLLGSKRWLIQNGYLHVSWGRPLCGCTIPSYIPMDERRLLFGDPCRLQRRRMFPIRLGAFAGAERERRDDDPEQLLGEGINAQGGH